MLKEEAKRPTLCYMIVITVLLGISGLLLVFRLAAFDAVFQSIVNKQVALIPGTMSYGQFFKPTPAIYKIATMYNIENSAEVLNGDDPVIRPMGPYYFREYREKFDHKEVDNEEIWFHERKWYIFDSEKSNPNPNVTAINPDVDLVHTINIAYVAIAYNLSMTPGSAIEEDVVDIIAGRENERNLFMNKTVNEILFGYDDLLLEAVSLVMPGLPTRIQVVQNMSQVDLDTWSIVRNGRYKPEELGQYTQWQGMTKLPYWASDEANVINGTEGLFFNPGLKKNGTLGTFTDDLFRSSIMGYSGEETIYGIPTYRYSIPDYAMYNATLNPNNAGFYSYLPNGLMNLTAATNAPVCVSKPSFLDGDDFLHEEVSGLAPPDRSMDTNIWVEPTTGCLIKASKQLQLNMMIQRNKHFKFLKTLRPKARFIPLGLILESGGLDDDLVKLFKKSVFLPRDIFLYTVLTLIISVCIAAMVVMGFMFRFVRSNLYNSDETQILLPEDDSVKPLLRADNPNLV